MRPCASHNFVGLVPALLLLTDPQGLKVARHLQLKGRASKVGREGRDEGSAVLAHG